MRACRAVANRLRLCVGLVPYDVRTEIPTGILQRERQPPGDSDKILRLQPFGRRRTRTHSARHVLFVGRAISTPSGGVRVPDVEPQGAVVAEYPVDLLEDAHEALDERLHGLFETDLPVDPVVPERPVRGLRNRD